MHFTKVGKPWTEGREAEFETKCGEVTWVDIHDPGLRDNICWSAGMGIREIIQSLHLVNVTHIAEDQQFAPACLLGIRTMNGDQVFEIFMLDHGDEAVPICHTKLE